MAVERKKKRPFLLPGIAVGLILLTWLIFRGPPGEQKLVERFQQNRAAFTELRAMLATNSPGAPIQRDTAVWSVEHYRRYKELLRQTGVIRTLRVADEFKFLVAEKGSDKKGYHIDVTWTETKPLLVLNRLKDFRKAADKPEHAYRSLEGNWYLCMTK